MVFGNRSIPNALDRLIDCIKRHEEPLARFDDRAKAVWDYKRERIGKSLLALNRDIADNPEWGEQEIRDRGEKLAESAHLVWPGLNLSVGT